eukprot:scaffold63030_cov48-Phaeocystis_antarctica.AAC.2
MPSTENLPRSSRQGQARTMRAGKQQPAEAITCARCPKATRASTSFPSLAARGSGLHRSPSTWATLTRASTAPPSASSRPAPPSSAMALRSCRPQPGSRRGDDRACATCGSGAPAAWQPCGLASGRCVRAEAASTAANPSAVAAPRVSTSLSSVALSACAGVARSASASGPVAGASGGKRSAIELD